MIPAPLRAVRRRLFRVVHQSRRRSLVFLREILHPADQSWDAVYQASNRREQYRRAVLTTLILAAATVANIPIVLVAGYGYRLDVLGVSIGEAAASVILLLVVAPRLHREPSVLALLAGATATVTVMAFGLLDPALEILVTSYLVIVPLASTILLFWRLRTHIAALAAYYAWVVAYVMLAPISLEPNERAATLITCGVACGLSAFGNFEGTMRRHDRARRWHTIREQQAALRALARERELEARTDSLTGLGSRRALDEDLVVVPAALAAAGRRTAVAILDLDRFKLYNDHFGHAAGDALLARIGEALREGLRRGDIAYRYGGEEFLILLPDASPAEAGEVIERIRARLDAEGIEHPENAPWRRATFSAGVAEIPPGQARRPERALALADRRLYAAKTHGRNCTVLDEAGQLPLGWRR